MGSGGEEYGKTPMVASDVDEDESRTRGSDSGQGDEKLRECFIQNKWPKRQLPPSAEQQRGYENEAVSTSTAAAMEFDPLQTKISSLDLIYQFHAWKFKPFHR